MHSKSIYRYSEEFTESERKFSLNCNLFMSVTASFFVKPEILISFLEFLIISSFLFVLIGLLFFPFLFVYLPYQSSVTVRNINP